MYCFMTIYTVSPTYEIFWKTCHVRLVVEDIQNSETNCIAFHVHRFLIVRGSVLATLHTVWSEELSVPLFLLSSGHCPYHCFCYLGGIARTTIYQVFHLIILSWKQEMLLWFWCICMMIEGWNHGCLPWSLLACVVFRFDEYWIDIRG